ncbi:MAG: AsnC family transcriptional regulator [Candidatus Bathyarchaeia archaeon]
MTAVKEKLDELDLKIVDLLSDDARRPVKNIAEKIGVTRLTVARRLEKLVKSGLIAVNVGLNLKKLGFRTAYIGFEIKGREKRSRFLELLTKCPRVLTILQPEAEANMMVYCYGETNATLESFIERMRDSFMDRIVYVHYSEPPIYPDKICIKAYPEKNDVAPCGMVCEDCENYKNERCLGCPAVKAYHGFI